jgi:hypothetical protein
VRGCLMELTRFDPKNQALLERIAASLKILTELSLVGVGPSAIKRPSGKKAGD